MIPKMHEEFINNSIELLKADSRLVGVTVGGSYIYGDMDGYSDVDLIIAIKPEYVEEVMGERQRIAEGLGELLSAFTGEHVNEPRLLICLYGPPLLHVDLKFVSLNDIAKRVEDPVILWERGSLISDKLKDGKAVFPKPDLQWIEDRFWVWVHYGATKIGRKELFETIDFISFLRQQVIGPFILMKNDKLPRGVRKIEQDAPGYLSILKKTVPEYDVISCSEALETIIEIYLDLREHFKSDSLILHKGAQKYSREYLKEVVDKHKGM